MFSGKCDGILVYVRENLISRRLDSLSKQTDIQAVPFELNVRKKKWLILTIYKRPEHNSKYFIKEISKLIDRYSKFDQVLILGDFN